MKSKRYASASAKCPYYKAQEAQIIFCTGIEEGHALHQAFATPMQRKLYGRMYCETDWTRCPYAKIQEGMDES